MSPNRKRTQMTALLALGLLLAVLLGGCQPITADKATLPWLEENEEPAQDLSAASLSELNETEAALATRAIDDLAATTGVDPASITLVSIEPVEWRDSSLGCPQPDMMYAQMLTPGYRIVLSTGDETVEYHTTTNADGPMVHCEETQ